MDGKWNCELDVSGAVLTVVLWKWRVGVVEGEKQFCSEIMTWCCVMRLNYVHQVIFCHEFILFLQSYVYVYLIFHL